ncbi:hypothetical protein MARBORIA2_06310 [Methanobrevibacter arboriphilus]|jgi:hypothetical protein|uniref:Uncharacterized protein n=2 Tax=Methanobrevibacter arboriphilus TaxID=39441 RepID=A0ACA8R103_METAZ|nr:hypothetical protein [Methanobrevibacter arboriphilus]BBL61021.1 hypothetical protein MarbSA_00610 [Methanobrevibacter arboriphilus]GLI11541.1 hypothetical protein MARBORIA2_06310 [Methanobrevibacter arboriphilus]
MLTNENMKKCNVKNLILIISALYLLNLFYKYKNAHIYEKCHSIGGIFENPKFLERMSLHSELFSLKIFNEYDSQNNNNKEESALSITCYHFNKHSGKGQKMTLEYFEPDPSNLFAFDCLSELSINM